MHINIHGLTSERLKSGAFKDTLPEYYNLAVAVENNSWHKDQNVFDHCISVLAALEKILEQQRKDQPWLQAFLNQTHGKYTRQQLLIIATVLHDIAKPQTLIINADGSTSCPGHERIGSCRVPDFSERFTLDKRGEQQIRHIVRDHDFPSTIVSLIRARGNVHLYCRYLREFAPYTYTELLLLEQADMLGCNAAPHDEVEHRIKITEAMLR